MHPVGNRTTESRPRKKLAPALYKDIRDGIWIVRVLAARQEKGIRGQGVTAELRRCLYTKITDYYDGIRSGSKGCRSSVGSVDHDLSKLRENVIHACPVVE